MDKNQLIKEIVEMEWQQFQNVHNEGGRASCQDDKETFEIMRNSQFLVWNEEVLKSYLADLQDAWADGWNLLTEKYARMMESTAPKEYEAFRDILPKRSEERICLQEEVIQAGNCVGEDFARRYRSLAVRKKDPYTPEDTAGYFPRRLI